MHEKASYGSFGNHHFAFPDLYIQNSSTNVYEYNCVEFPYVYDTSWIANRLKENMELLTKHTDFECLVIVMINNNFTIRKHNQRKL